MTTTTNHTVTTARRVRIVGDTFKHVYTLVGQVDRTQRDGHRLYGGDTHYVLVTWAGRERTATCVVDADTPWNERDTMLAGIMPRHRAAVARRAKARQ